MNTALDGLTIIELSGIGPVPFTGMMLADHGARVIKVERPGGVSSAPGLQPENDILSRSREHIQLDLKHPAARSVFLDLIKIADGLIEGYRPGVMERLALGPAELHTINPKLVFGRMTGWGQTGPLGDTAGHDINYISISGVLHAIGPRANPVMPLNLVGDFGGGGMLLAFGMLSAILAAQRTGTGQVVDAAMTDGSALLLAMTHSFLNQGQWKDQRSANLLDGGAGRYNIYETRDGKHVAIGAIEDKFLHSLLHLLEEELPADFDHDSFNEDELKRALQYTFARHDRYYWDELLTGSDACYSPVLSLSEAVKHMHNVDRRTFVSVNGKPQPAPAPRYSASQTIPPGSKSADSNTRDLMRELGYSDVKIEELITSGAAC